MDDRSEGGRTAAVIQRGGLVAAANIHLSLGAHKTKKETYGEVERRVEGEKCSQKGTAL